MRPAGVFAAHADLLPGEEIVLQARPVYAKFAQRFLFRAVLTIPLIWVIFGAVMPSGLSGPLLWAGGALGLALFYGVVLGDHGGWREARDSVWVLTTRRLIYVPASEPQTALPLTDIRSTHAWFSWGLRLRLVDGRGLKLDFIEKPAAFRAALQDAQTRAKEGA